MNNAKDTPAKPAAKPARAKAAAPTGTLVAVASAKAAGGKARDGLKLKELVEAVTTATNGKKKDVKAVIEATLASLGVALSKGRDLNLPPLGKAKVGRQMDQASGELIVIKLHRGGAKGAGAGAGKGKGGAEKAAKEALAEPQD